MNKVSISTGCLPRLESRPFYELSSATRMMKRFLKESVADGFEFVLFPEWDSGNSPLTPSDAPSDCERHTIEEIAEALEGKGFPILSVHANRDIGNYLCSEDAEKVSKGIRLVDECLRFTRKVGSRICVFHLWDTWKETIDLAHLQTVYKRFQKANPDIAFSVENVPTRIKGMTPFQLVKSFQHKTLDLKWASLFNEFDAFAKIVGQVDNVHIQGKYEDEAVVPTVGVLKYERALDRIKEAGYKGIFTIELEGKASYGEMLKCVAKLRESLK